MSKPKSIDAKKIFESLDKATLRDRIGFFNELKERLTRQIEEQAREHEQQQNELLSLVEKINQHKTPNSNGNQENKIKEKA